MILRHFLPSTFTRRKISVLLAGCGGTGSRVLSGLAQIDVALRALGHPGLTCAVFDADRVSEANIGRQLFSPADIGRYKAEVLCTRINMFFGLSWRAVPMMVTKETAKSGSTPEEAPAMMEMVPVGAMVVTVALRIFPLPGRSKMEPLKLGKVPRTLASSREAACPSSLMNFITFSPRAIASLEL